MSKEIMKKEKIHSEPLAWIFEDELPKNYPYEEMFPYSKVDVVRMFPIFGPSSKQEQESTDWEAVAADQALTIALLKAELEQDEPVALVAEVHTSRYTIEWTNGPLPEGTKLYAKPQPRKPLTDEQKKNIFLKFYGKHWAYTDQIKHVMEAVEAAHGIKE